MVGPKLYHTPATPSQNAGTSGTICPECNVRRTAVEFGKFKLCATCRKRKGKR